MFYIIVLSAIFLIFFFVQKTVYTYAQSIISKFMPVVILCGLLMFCYTAYRIEIYLIKSRAYYITMQIDGTDIAYSIVGICLLTALIGCIVGIAYIKIAEMILKKK